MVCYINLEMHLQSQRRWFNDMLKLHTVVNDEYQHLLTEDELLANCQWFEEQVERIFSLEHKIIKWLKEPELNKE